MSSAQSSMTRRQKVEERERAILSAAREAFLEFGYDGARMADIASRAGVAEGTVYLYYKTKSELMHAFVADFWDDLTRSARDAVREIDNTFDALRALASFHLQNLLDRFDVVELTQSGRVKDKRLQENREFMRTYVTVFDEIWRRGIDRGDLSDEIDLWIVRDLFFGPLEYSARSIRLNSNRRADDAVENLVGVLKEHHGKKPGASLSRSKQEALLERLERAVIKLEEY